MNARSKSRLKLVILACLFFGPLLIATYLHQNGFRFEQWGHTEHGKLLSPVMHINELGFTDASGKTPELPHRWVVLYVDGAACEQELCFSRLHEISQMHHALGKHQKRIEKWLVTTLPVSEETKKKLGPAFKTVMVDEGKMGKDAAYIVDPLGNVVMRFDQEDSTHDMLKDIRKLFKYSTIG